MKQGMLLTHGGPVPLPVVICHITGELSSSERAVTSELSDKRSGLSAQVRSAHRSTGFAPGTPANPAIKAQKQEKIVWKSLDIC